MFTHRLRLIGFFSVPVAPGACNMVTHLYPEKEAGMRKPPE